MQAVPMTTSESSILLNSMLKLDMAFYNIIPANFIFPKNHAFIYNQLINSSPQDTFKSFYNGTIVPDKEWRSVRSFRFPVHEVNQLFKMTEDKMAEWSWNRGSVKATGPRTISIDELLEAPALARYSLVTGFQVRTAKSFVNPRFPFIVAQLDGIAFVNGQPSHVVEVKKMPYNFFVNPEPAFFNLHPDYSISLVRYGKINKQVQINMFVSNLTSADVVFYNEDDNSVYIITVDRDDQLIGHMLKKFYYSIQNHVYPTLVKKYMTFNE